MNNLKRFNQTIDYIESELVGEISPKKVMQLSGYSLVMFGRIFSIMAGFPLGEYIRLRKLTLAAFDLRHSQEKVIDIALKYGYESVDAFSAAFKKFHHQTPSAVRNGADYQVCAVVNFALTVIGGRKMNIRIEQKGAFKVAGWVIQATPEADFSGLWAKLYQEISHEQFAQLGSGQSFGACYEMNSMDSFKYMAGYDVVNVEQAKALGLTVLDVPAAEYAVVEIVGAVPESIHNGWKYALEKLLPENNYKRANSPDFEVYSEGDISSPNYKMELWIPIIRE